LSRKAVHKCVKKFSQRLSRITDDARSGAEVAAGFGPRIKEWDKYIDVAGGSVERLMFSRFEYQMLYVSC
jgi:hypothetical protein